MLDALSCEIWLRADGQTTLGAIARDIAGISGISVETMCRTASILIVILNSEGVMFAANEPDSLPYHLQHPQEDQDLGRMRESMAAAGWLDE